MSAPETRYAKTADGVHIAYQVVGEGPVEMVFVMGWVTNIEAMWDDPGFAAFLDRLGLVLAADPVRQAWGRALRSVSRTTDSPTSRPGWTMSGR